MAARKQAVAHQARQRSTGVFAVAVDGMDCTVPRRQELFLYEIGCFLAEKSLAEKKEELCLECL